MIVCALHMGIGKRELMEDYYPDEIGAIFESYNALHGGKKTEEVQAVDALEFFGIGGDGN